jgi:putative membrane protein
MTHRLPSAAGATILAALWLGPLPLEAGSRFSAHMLLHIGVVAVAAPLLAVGLGELAGRRIERWPVLLHPVTASVAELTVVWSWHAPLLHLAAREHTAVLIVEQVSFLIAGVWLWLSAGAGWPARDTNRAWTGTFALLFTSIHMTLLGALFALAPRPLYHHHGPGALTDQHLGGSLMLLIGGGVYLAGGLWLARRGLVARNARSAT